jgi:L-alanine-DL-glutamate epimerase-like enolase superfamily enzyme
MLLNDFTLTRFQFRRNRVIGDSQVRFDQAHVAVLELHDRDGRTGTGFLGTLAHPLPALPELTRLFHEDAWPALDGQHPAPLLNRLARPRGGNWRAGALGFGQAINQALWDLHGQALGLPLWRLLGGREGRVPAYASGLEFHLDDDAFRSLFGQAHAMGFRAFKVKIGHPDVAWDLHRLAVLREVVGAEATVMVDSNEAWSTKEAIRRLRLYLAAGHHILWAEDPILRDDFVGLAEIRRSVPEIHVNSGEYLDLHGKRQLMEARAVDILNVHGHVSDVMKAGWLAAEYGIPVSLGNTPMELGVHMAAALPECRWLEYSFHNTACLLEEPVQIRDGWAYAPDRPGHGLAMSERARRELAAPEILRPEELPPAPRGPIEIT